MRSHRFRLTIFAVLLLVSLGAAAADRMTDLRPTVILVSIDGFRADYLDHIETPNLHAVMRMGLHAKYMIPVFPTKTLPNHYTIVTGLYPAHHGIVANNFYDPEFGKFAANDAKFASDPRWWSGGEPIWIAAEKQGIHTAPQMWPGSTAPHAGILPKFSKDYDKKETSAVRLQDLLKLLDLPADERPQLLTLYLDIVDEAGHHFGPGSPEVRDAVHEADATIGHLLDALRERGIDHQVDLVIVSDHGMTAVSRKKTVIIDDYLDLNTVDIIDGSPVVALIPKEGIAQPLYEKLKRVPHAKAYLADDLPARWHYSGSPRITPVVVVVEPGWTINSNDYLAKHAKLDVGNHGFDNADKDMRAIFMAEGPDFRHATMKPFPNVDVYSLLAELLHVKPAANDGTGQVFHPYLKKSN